MKVRMVVMVPQVVEEEYTGPMEELDKWAKVYVSRFFHGEEVETKLDRGPVDGTYTPLLMETVVTNFDHDPLEEMIAPGGVVGL